MAIFGAANPSSGGPQDDTTSLLAQLGITAPPQSQGTNATPQLPGYSPNAAEVQADAASAPDGGPLAAVLNRGQTGTASDNQAGPSIPPGFIAPPPAMGKVGPLEMIGDALLGGAPTLMRAVNHSLQMKDYQRQAGMAQLQRAYGVVQQAAQSGALKGTDLLEAAANPQAYMDALDAGMKARMSTPLKVGEMFATGADGQAVQNFTTGVDAASGKPFASSPATGQTTFGPSAGGDYAEDASGNVVSKRTGQAGASVPTYQNFAPGNFHGWVQAGAPGAAGAGSAPSATLTTGSGPNGAPANIGEALRMRWSQQGVPVADQAGLLATGKIESNFDPGARNGSSRGLYQFQPATFASVGGQDINDPGQQADAAAKLWASNRQALSQTLGRAPTDSDLYLAHQQGAGGASALIRAPAGQNAIQALVQAGIYKNPAVARRAIMNNGGTRQTTAGQFVQGWADKFGKAMGATGGASPSGPAGQGASAPGSGALGSEALSGGQGYTMNSDGTQTAPDGQISAVPGKVWAPENIASIRAEAMKSEEYQQAQAAGEAYDAMTKNAKTMTGPSAYAMLDTFARAINPGAVARPQVIETIEKSLGPLNHVEGGWAGLQGQGSLTPQVRQQIIDAVQPFVSAHWRAANAINQSNRALASRHGINPDDVTAPLGASPRRFSVSLGKALPNVGDVEMGHRYLGGDPHDPRSWTKAP